MVVLFTMLLIVCHGSGVIGWGMYMVGIFLRLESFDSLYLIQHIGAGSSKGNRSDAKFQDAQRFFN